MLNSGNGGLGFESSQGLNGHSQMTKQVLPVGRGEISNSGHCQYNSQSSQWCNGPSEKTNQFAQYAGPMLNSGNGGLGFEISQGLNGHSQMTKQLIPVGRGEISNSGHCQYNSQSSQGCNGPSEKTNQFAQYAGPMLNSGNSGLGFESSQGLNGHSQMTKKLLQVGRGEISNSGHCQYNSQSSQGCNGPSEKTNQFAQYAGPILNSGNCGSGFESSKGVNGHCQMTKQLLPKVGGPILNSGNCGSGFESSQGLNGHSQMIEQLLPKVGCEISNSGHYQYNFQSSQGCNGPSEKTNQFAQYASPMLNSDNYGFGFESSQGLNGHSQMTKQLFPEVGGEMSNSGHYQHNSQRSQGCNGRSQAANQFAQYGVEELELWSRKRKSHESQSERISDVLEKGSIAENVVPDAAQSMSGERRGIKVPQFQSQSQFQFQFHVEVPRTTDPSVLKTIIMEALGEQVDKLLQVKKYKDESWSKPKPSQSPVNVLHQGRMIGNEIKIQSDNGNYYENKIKPKPPQALVSPCPRSGANLIHHPCDIPHPLTRYAPTPDVVPQETHNRNTNTLGHKSMAIDEGTSSSIELMVSPGADVNTLVPHQVCPKSNSSKKNKGRRCKNKEPGSKNEGPSRKTYSDEEVKSLVEEVDKCGIGRWKEIHNGAFKNDGKRNPDDLRDKWKSLVHTAKLPPGSRRSKVPEELLEKVLKLDGAKRKLQGQTVPASGTESTDYDPS